MPTTTATETQRLAERVFSLRSETLPTWIDGQTFAWLDDRTGVPHLRIGSSDVSSHRVMSEGADRIQSLLGGGRGVIVVGTDVGGNERQQLVRIDVERGEQMLLTSDADLMHEPFVLTPDGSAVILRINDGASGEFSLWSLATDGSSGTCLWQDAGQVRAHDVDDAGHVLASLLTTNLDADLFLIAPDGTRTALMQSEDESWILDAAFAPRQGGYLVLTNAGSDLVSLQHIEAESGERSVLIAADGDVEAFALSPDGGTIVWSVNDGGFSRVSLAPVDDLASGIEVALPPGVMDRFAWSPDGDAVLVGWLPATSPSRIHRIATDGTVAPAFSGDADAFTGVSPETIDFGTFDGRRIPSFWWPADDPTAPVVIDVHGGPESQRRPGFNPLLQFLAASGFHVLSTNVRGSTGYGKAYSHLDDIELRMDAVRDLEHARAWVAERVPDSQIAVMGQSYGGFMTLAAITEYPDLWYAAVDVVGICNFVTFFERTGAYRRRHRAAEYGSLERDRALLTEISPIRKVDAITAPLLVIHGRNDPRVPLFEAEQLVASLEQRGHPVELLVYDDEGHGLSKRTNRIDGYARAVTFLHERASQPGRVSGH